MKIIWTPVKFYDDWLFQCSVEDEQAGAAQATSRSKPRALAFALEELAKRYHKEADDERQRLRSSGQPDPSHPAGETSDAGLGAGCG